MATEYFTIELAKATDNSNHGKRTNGGSVARYTQTQQERKCLQRHGIRSRFWEQLHRKWRKIKRRRLTLACLLAQRWVFAVARFARPSSFVYFACSLCVHLNSVSKWYVCPPCARWCATNVGISRIESLLKWHNKYRNWMHSTSFKLYHRCHFLFVQFVFFWYALSWVWACIRGVSNVFEAFDSTVTWTTFTTPHSVSWFCTPRGTLELCIPCTL